jgi:hypothetical protein
MIEHLKEARKRFFRVGKNWKPSESELFFYLVVMVLIFIAASRIPLDSDMWWHLRSGEVTVKQGSPVLSDLFSFTVNGKAWINHSWLSQVGMYEIFQWFGFMGLTFAVALIATLSMAFLYEQMDGNGIFRGFTMVLGLLVAAPVWSARPQLMSLLFMAVTQFILFRYKWKQKDELWILPILFIFWSNFHGGYPLGLLVFGAMIAGEMTDHLLGFSGAEILSWGKIRRLMIVAFLCGLVVIINPNGLDMWRIPFQTVEVNTVQKFIIEWASPDFHDLVQMPFLWLIMVTIAAMGISGKRTDGYDIISVILFGSMALLARRNFGPFALAATPVLSRQLWVAWLGLNERTGVQARLVEFLERYQSKNSLPDWVRRSINLGIVGFLMFCAGCKLFVVSHPILINQQIEQGQPAAAIRWMKANHINGNLLNEYGWGGFLDWSARDNSVFVDGRTDLFGDKVLGDWMELVQAGPGWKEKLASYPVQYVLVEPSRPLVNALAQNGWHKLYEDKIAVLFGKK